MGDDRECSGEPRDLCESFGTLDRNRIGLEKRLELRGDTEMQIAYLSSGVGARRGAGRARGPVVAASVSRFGS